MSNQEHTTNGNPSGEPIPYGSNSFRLSLRQWILVLALSVSFVVLLPPLWKDIEKFELEPDYRMPYDLSNDYWLFDRYSRLAASRYDTVLMGDSVIWGQYVTREQTLSHHLNELSGSERFANLGVDGAHPVALDGLLEHYAAGVSGKNVILLFNPLWITSAKADLKVDEEVSFNHPRLVPQFAPDIRCYKEQMSPRLGIVVEQHVPFSGWTSHLQLAYFNKSDVPAWTLDHPYESLVSASIVKLPASDNKLRHEPVPWTEHGAAKQDFPFVELKTSLQWRAFQRAVTTLQNRGNKVFVVVGPLNEHMLTEESVRRYHALKREIEQWLLTQNVTYCVPNTLPSELYADLSHPLNGGYRLLAKQILDQQRTLAKH